MLKVSRIVLVVITVLTVVFAILIARGMKMDYRYETFFPKDDPELEYFLQFRSQFESDDDFLLIAVENKAGIFDAKFLAQVKSLSDSLAHLSSVVEVISPVKNLNYYKSDGLALSEIPYLHWDEPSQYHSDSLRIFKAKHLVGTFFSADRKALSIFIKTKDRLARIASNKLLKELDALLLNYHFDALHSISRINAQKHYMEVLGSELTVFILSSIALLIVVLWFSFRSVVGVVIPLITVVAALIWTLALMLFCGKDIDVLAALLPTMIFIVGMSDVVHILTNYIEELREGHSKMDAIKTTFKEVGFATFLTCISTAVGFFTLMTANIQPIRDFGLYAGIGVCMAYVLAFTLLPSVLLNIKTPKIVNATKNDRQWNKMLTGFLLICIRHPKKILGVSLLVTVLSVIAMSTIKIDNFLLEDLSDQDEIKKDFLYFEDKFSGARPFEMVVDIADTSKSIWDYEVLKEMEKVETFLLSNYHMNFVASPLAFVKEANKTWNGAAQKYYCLPDNKAQYDRLRENLEFMGAFQKGEEQMRKYMSADKRRVRFSGKVVDIGGAKMKERNLAFFAFYKRSVNQHLITCHLTGTATLIDLNNESLSKNMIYGLWLSVGFIALIVGWMFRSIRMVIVAIIPNVVPGLMIAGFMGLVGIDLKVSTSIIFSIAFGIAVDDTIHIISRLKLEIKSGKSFLYALKRTYLSTGKAVVVTSVILSAGFLTLIFSTFTSTFYVGLLVSLTLVLAIGCELFILPVLLFWYYKKEKQSKSISKD